MKICYMSGSSFGLDALKNLVNNGYNVSKVYTKAPKPKGRGLKVLTTSIHDYAKLKNISVETPINIKDINTINDFINQKFDICIVASYGKILPKEILNAPKMGCINIHASLLPKYRGASPIQKSIEQGDSKTGITIMQMDEGLDTGDILLQDSVDINREDDFLTLHEKLANLGGKLILQYMENLNKINPIKQDDAKASLSGILTKKDYLINFNNDAIKVNHFIRSRSPRAYFIYDSLPYKTTKTKIHKLSHNKKYGSLISQQPFLIACENNSAIELMNIQKSGKKMMSIEDFNRGFTFNNNTRFND